MPRPYLRKKRRRRLTSWKSLPEPVELLGSQVAEWYRLHGRDFPWRHTNHPFRLLCTEIMLQRTRAVQVADIYRKAVARWDSPYDVLDFGQEGVRALFERLGLVWRAEYFWQLQHTLVHRFRGKVPRSWASLLELPGVGEYVAASVLVFAFGESRTVVDANVLRIFGRYYGITFPDHARRSPSVLQWASDHAPGGAFRCRQFNWGLLDLGAQVCTPGNPAHSGCPLSDTCKELAGRQSLS